MARLETQFDMMNITEEDDLISEPASTSAYDKPSSSFPSLSPVYYSPRIHSMIENQSRFTSETELEIEYSREHWSELAGNVATRLENRAHFEKLKAHPEWGGFFKDMKVELGEKINEGGQAEIYDAKVEFKEGLESAGYGYHVVKVMKGDCPLEDFQRQWPVGMLCNASKQRVKGPLMWIKGGTMVDDRFAFVMVRQWGDLRKLIDMKMRLNNNQGPPFASLEFVRKVMLCIARDMKALHTEYNIVHRDLKASNVLLWSLGEELPGGNPHVKANVVDYECSVGVVGTGFWRASEILEQVKNRVLCSELVFTCESDVYSYGMVCYELLTGRTPFEGHSLRDHGVVLDGNRPELPQVPWESRFLVRCVEMCWSAMPSERPTFSEIVQILKPPDSSLAEEYRIDKMKEIEEMFGLVWEGGDLRKLIDMKMQLNKNQGPPFSDYEFVRKVMLCIARDMDELCTKYKLIHRDLKASNVLMRSFAQELPDASPHHVEATVMNYECSVGMVGTGFWRAPEILEQLKKRIPRSMLVFTCESAVYSYGMLCYELLTGRTPFEGHPPRDYDVVLRGHRPDLPKLPRVYRFLVEIVEMCWSKVPRGRPSFSEIVKSLDSMRSLTSVISGERPKPSRFQEGFLQSVMCLPIKQRKRDGPHARI